MQKTTKSYRKLYEAHYNIRLLPGIEIHHIDGNHFNNDISNLIAVTPEEHFNIHLSQGDYAAALLITRKHSIPAEERSKLASLAASKGNKEGKCGFVLGHASAAGKVGGIKGGAYAKENRTGIFALTKEQIKEKNVKAGITKMIKSGRACAWPR